MTRSIGVTRVRLAALAALPALPALPALAALPALLVAACGGPPHSSAQASQKLAASAQIELREQIAADWQVLRHLRFDPSPELRLYQPDPRPTVSVCQTRDAICALTATVCTRAARAGDSWSYDKCRNARAACRDAEQRCCACVINARSPSDHRLWCGNAR